VRDLVQLLLDGEQSGSLILTAAIASSRQQEIRSIHSSYRRTTLDGQPLHPTTQMVSFGYDPALSEGAVKPPVFLTSTFAFRSAEEGAEFFDVVAGRKPAPEGMGAGGLVYSRFNHPNTEIVEDPWRSSTARKARCSPPPAWRRSAR